ncbi:MAG TPA: hypothetical protein VGR12_07430 [Solirubrobacteraceae bacterium]|nr:hypothetical protein [Solirubrobacteraceae bacterium]
MRRGGYRLVMRLGPRVEKERFPTLEEALDALDARIPSVSRREPRSALGRDYDPVRQVAGRLELHGPGGTHGGIDVRGDGTAEAYTGWIRKRLVEPQGGESAVDALRRMLERA